MTPYEGYLHLSECFLLFWDEILWDDSCHWDSSRAKKVFKELLEFLSLPKSCGKVHFHDVPSSCLWRNFTLATLFRIFKYVTINILIYPAGNSSLWTDSKSTKTVKKSCLCKISYLRQMDAASWQCTWSHCILSKSINFRKRKTSQ